MFHEIVKYQKIFFNLFSMILPNIEKYFTFKEFIFLKNYFSKKNYFSINKHGL